MGFERHMKSKTTIYMYSTTLIFDIILFVMTFPFVVVEYDYSNDKPSCVWIEGSRIKLTLRQWMLVDASVMLSLVVIMFIVSLMFMTTPRCFCIHTFHVWLCWIFGLFRLAWLVIGSVLFWGDIDSRDICQKSVSRFMYANLIFGLIYSALYFVAGCMFPQPTIRLPR